MLTHVVLLQPKPEASQEDLTAAYKKMRLIWPHEQRVKDLADLFYSEHHD